jgi:hypothetical protein
MMASQRLRLAQSVQDIGRPGIVGIALLMFSLAFAASTLGPSWRELDRQRAAAGAEEGTARNGLVPASRDAASPAAELRAFYAIFPPQSQAPELLSRLYAAAAENRLQLLRGEYVLSAESQTGLTRYRIVLPVRGSYSQIRAFIGAVLRAVPAAALDEVSFERSRVSERGVDARIRLTLYVKGSS